MSQAITLIYKMNHVIHPISSHLSTHMEVPALGKCVRAK